MAHASEQIIPLYERHGPAWFALRKAGRFVERAWLDRFIQTMPFDGDSVLDLGCGGGEPIAGYLSGQGLRVTGVDTSASMLDICRGERPEAEWLKADMRTLALGRRFDGILAWDSFFHLSQADQRAMFAVFAAHAAPDAALMFTSGPAAGEAFGELEGETLYHASLAPGEYRALLSANGFEVVQFVPEDPECGGHTVWLCRAGEGRAGQ